MRRKTKEEFIEQARKIHGDKYDYSKTQYVKAKEKVCIICKEKDEFGRIHGEFWQTPDNHINGKNGCPKCAKNLSLTTEEFILKAREVHGYKYDYSKVKYINNVTLITITCPKHGDFKQLPLNHLKGEGCYKCGREHTGDAKRVSVEESIQKAKLIHGDKYDYSLTHCKKVADKVTIICPIHGKFRQTMNNHLKGQGCPKCSQSKGEKSITNFLNNKNIKYVSQYRVKIDKNINLSGNAYIDFYLPDYNIFIEYNGEQHYVPKEFFGGEIELKRQQDRDQYIRTYCKENNIKLLEIKYNENVELKLNEVYEQCILKK